MPVMSAKYNQVRIIAGQWRGRKLGFPDVAGLRPTPDRVRETLFNWLAPVLPGAHCLDLFAGSGALGFEAASRGAARVVMVERQVDVIQGDAKRYLARLSARFDVVFLDPPFSGHDLLVETLGLLQCGHYLNDGAHIYVETAADPGAGEVPADWEPWRQKRAGAVCYRLYRCRSPDRTPPGAVGG
jgi:16S rRNA (guanine966-N2)-methyltransferase